VEGPQRLPVRIEERTDRRGHGRPGGRGVQPGREVIIDQALEALGVIDQQLERDN
jgi:hypothetical protein